jgi:hypothetical protein
MLKNAYGSRNRRLTGASLSVHGAGSAIAILNHMIL